MMRNQIINNYAEVLYELKIPDQIIEETNQLFQTNDALLQALESPVVTLEEKEAVIDRIFPEEIRNFLKIACRHQSISKIKDIFKAYKEYCEARKGMITADLYYVEKPDDKQLAKMKAFIAKKYHGSDVNLKLTEDKSLLGGFILKVNSEEYDWSLKGRLNRLQQKLTWR